MRSKPTGVAFVEDFKRTVHLEHIIALAQAKGSTPVILDIYNIVRRPLYCTTLYNIPTLISFYTF